MNKKRNRKTKGNGNHDKKLFTFPLKIFLIIGCLVIIAFNVFKHSFFKISQVFVEGNSVITDEYILSKIENPVGKTIFTYSDKKNSEKLLESGNIKSVTFKKELPDKLIITVSETYPVMEFTRNDVDYYISNEGIVSKAESDDENENENLISYDSDDVNVEIGKKFTNNDDILKFFKEIQKYSYIKNVKELNFENTDDIGIIVKDIQVEFGDLSDSSYKLKLLDSVLKDIDQKKMTANRIILDGKNDPVVEVDSDSSDQ